MNILHLSDIHFGRNHYNIHESFDKKNQILDELISTVVNLPSVMKPNLILVTGDIAWYGKSQEYDEAFIWFQKLLDGLDIEGEQVVFCPGNHDVNRGAAVSFKETDLCDEQGKLDIKKCDNYYQYENAHFLEARFCNYNLFCQKMGMQPYSYKLEDGRKEYSYLIGNSVFKFGNYKYQIICFNTAWLPYGNVLNDDQMFLGLPQIESMQKEGILCDSESKGKTNVFRIALFHHADRFLHPNEQCEYNGRKAPLSLLLQSVDLALCGHTETGGMPVIRAYKNGGSLLTGGAVYYNDEHPNSFSLIHVDEADKNIETCSFYYNGSKWSAFDDITKYLWRRQKNDLRWQDALSERKTYKLIANIDGRKYNICEGRFEINKKYVDGQEVVDFNNQMEPARCIDVLTQKEKLANNKTVQSIRIKHAPGRWQMISSRLKIAEYNYFVSSHIRDAENAFVGLVDNMGKFKYGFSLDRLKIEQVQDDRNIQMYKKLQELEQYYDIRFLYPYPEAPLQNDIEAVRLLIELKNMKSLRVDIEILESYFVAHNLQEITWARNVGANHGDMVFHFIRKIEFHLFNAIIPLGECDIYLKGFKIKDMNNVCVKINTWEEGDIRRIDTFAPNLIEWWLIPRDGEPKEDTICLDGVYVALFPEDAPLSIPDSMKDYIVECK